MHTVQQGTVSRRHTLFICPHCADTLALTLRVSLTSVLNSDPPESNALQPACQLQLSSVPEHVLAVSWTGGGGVPEGGTMKGCWSTPAGVQFSGQPESSKNKQKSSMEQDGVARSHIATPGGSSGSSTGAAGTRQQPGPRGPK